MLDYTDIEGYLNTSSDAYNSTEEEDDYYEYDLVGLCDHVTNASVQRVFGPYVHSVIFLLGILGNGLVIVTYACYKRTRSMTDVYLLNVAVADLLFVSCLPLIVYNELTAWSMGRAVCKILRGSYSVNLYSGMLLLACISADRYVAIVQARRSFRLRSVANSRLICCLVWAAAILLSVPTFYFYDWYEPSHTKGLFLDENEEQNSPPQYVCEFRIGNNLTAALTKAAVPGVQLTVGFFLPLVVMATCYSAILWTLRRARSLSRHKAVRVVLCVVCVFVLCHAPYNVTLLIATATMFNTKPCAEADALQTAKTVTQGLAYLHCCLNPLLYAFVGVKFRNHFRRIVRDVCCAGKRYATSRRCSRATSDMYVSTRSNENASSFTM